MFATFISGQILIYLRYTSKFRIPDKIAVDVAEITLAELRWNSPRGPFVSAYKPEIVKFKSEF